MTEHQAEEAVEAVTDEVADGTESSGTEHSDDLTAREDELLAEEPDAGVGLPRDDSGDIQTGHPAVDEVLRGLGALDGAPVDEHVAIFEQAHEELRRTLSGAGDDQD